MVPIEETKEKPFVASFSNNTKLRCHGYRHYKLASLLSTRMAVPPPDTSHHRDENNLVGNYDRGSLAAEDMRGKRETKRRSKLENRIVVDAKGVMKAVTERKVL